MTNRSAQARRASEETAPRPQTSKRLGVLDRRHVRARAELRQVRALVTLSALVVTAALVVVAGGHALLATGQVRLDSLQGKISSALAEEQNLQLQRAQLEAPSRILSIAKNELKMVTPSSVVYLPPVNPGESVLAAHESHRDTRSARR